MKERLEKRLKELKTEFNSGREMQKEFETKRLELESRMLRISGAIQVLEEELAKCPEPPSGAEVVEMKSADKSGEKESVEKAAEPG